MLQASLEPLPQAPPAEPEVQPAVQPPLLLWLPSVQRQVEEQLDEAELLPGGAAVAAGGAGFAAGGATGGAGGRITEGAGRVVCGVINRGAGAGGAAGFAAGGTGVAAGAGADGAAVFVSAGGRGAAGRTGVGGAAAACCFCVISFRTSPGLEMWERSILVLISSASRVERADRAGAASAVARKCARTLSASKSSSELEWVFFSVTPTSVRTSRIALLLTSSSLARSLIRILLIRPFFAPPLLLTSS